MKSFLFIAAIINAAVAVVHIIIGEAEILAPLLASDAPELVQATLRSAWHMISVVLLVSSIALFYAGLGDRHHPRVTELPTYIGIQYIALALVFVVTSFVYGQFFIQIVMLLPIGVLSLWAGRLARSA